jgi:hypothetical protein
VTTQPTTEQFYGPIRPVRDAMRALAQSGKAMRTSRGQLPDASSQGMEEIAAENRYATVWGLEPIFTAFTSAGLLLYAAEDHIDSLARLFDAPPPPVYGHQVLARAVLEAAARARWLLERRGGARCRVERVVANRVSALEAQVHLEDALKAPGATPSEEMAAQLERAEREGFAHRTRKGELALNATVPGYGALVRQLFKSTPFGNGDMARVVYSYYSAVVHGESHGILESLDRENVVVDALAGSASAPIGATNIAVVVAMAVATAGYMSAVDEQVALMGWSDDRWTAARSAAVSTMATAFTTASGQSG